MFSTLSHYLGTFFIGLAALFGVHQFGNTSPTGTVPAVFETYLASQQSSSDTTLSLASVSLRDGTNLSGYVCLTIDSNTPQLEYECGTLSGTTMTVSVRGIDATTGTSSVSSLKYQHRRGADVKITDYPAITIATNQLNGTQVLPAPLVYDPTVTNAQIQANNGNLVNYGLLSATAIAGAVPASPSTAGIAKLSTTAASTTNPIVVGDNDVRVSPVSLATVTSGQIAALLGSSSTPSSSNKYITQSDVATSSTANAIVRALSTGKIDTSFFSPQASSSWLGSIYGGGASITSTTTLFSTTIPGGSLGVNGAIKIAVPVNASPSASAGNLALSVFYGNATTTLWLTCPATGGGNPVGSSGELVGYISAIASTSVQRVTVLPQLSISSVPASNGVSVSSNISEATTTVDTTTNQTLRVSLSGTNCNTSAYEGVIEYIR